MSADSGHLQMMKVFNTDTDNAEHAVIEAEKHMDNKPGDAEAQRNCVEAIHELAYVEKFSNTKDELIGRQVLRCHTEFGRLETLFWYDFGQDYLKNIKLLCSGVIPYKTR